MPPKFWSVVFLCLVYKAAALEEGDSCMQDGEAGVCTLLEQCQSARASPQSKWWQLKRCGFKDIQPILCCVPLPATATTTTTTEPPTTPTTTTTTEEDDYVDYYPDELPRKSDGVSDTCQPLGPDRTTDKIGRKAYDKCIEYQEQLMYPCVKSVALMAGGWVRANNCRREGTELIVGGVDAKRNEFPHMVLLGYGRLDNGTAVWQCGGSLLSDRFILTAGHCTSTRLLGPVTYAIVGALRRSDDVGASQVYGIKRIIKHPDFNALSKKNDIALLETKTPVALGPSAIPACLDVFGGDVSRATATGWGVTATMGQNADTLQKVTLQKFRNYECRRHYPRRSTMGRFDPTTQVCYGEYSRAADTCQGDSGGPLTITNPKVHCMHTVIGVTSFGKVCGQPGVPGWYTKVSHYVTWIENIVWPDNGSQS